MEEREDDIQEKKKTVSEKNVEKPRTYRVELFKLLKLSSSILYYGVTPDTDYSYNMCTCDHANQS
jgi:hypothetical protein